MTKLDLGILGAYLMVMLAIAFYYRRYAQQGLENFFLAGRRVPGWLNGVSRGRGGRGEEHLFFSVS